MLKRLQLWCQPSLQDTIKQDLVDARLFLYEYQTKAEYYAHMVKLCQDTILRLNKTLEEVS